MNKEVVDKELVDELARELNTVNDLFKLLEIRMKEALKEEANNEPTPT